MTAQSAGAVVAPGGAVPDKEAQDTMCEAYRQAFDDYCVVPRIKKRGKFNDYFFNRMRGMAAPPASAAMAQQAAGMAGNIAREVPMLVDVGANGVGTAAQLASTAAGQPGVVGAIGSAFTAATQTAATGLGAAGGVTGLTTTVAAVGAQIRSCLGLAGYFTQAALPGSMLAGQPIWRCMRAAGMRTRFLDGLYRNNPLEIKGPFDSPRPNQLEDNKLLDPNREPFEASAESCGVAQSKVDACPR